MGGRAVILGAAGPAGRHLAPSLLARGHAVRVVGRSAARLAGAFADRPEVERVTADMRDPQAAQRVLEGCDLAVNCLGLPLGDALAAYPATARAIAAAGQRSGARLVHVSSFWSYLPDPALPVREDHARTGGPLPARLRREAEDVMQDAGACVAQLPDFFGPWVHVGTFQAPLRDAARLKPMTWIGDHSTAREVAYVPDAMRLVADLADYPQAYGERWLIPGVGPLGPRDLAEIVDAHLGRWVPVHTAGPTKLRIAAAAIKALRDFLPLVPDYCRPIHYDTGKLRALLGPITLTPAHEAIAATLDWLRANPHGPDPVAEAEAEAEAHSATGAADIRSA